MTRWLRKIMLYALHCGGLSVGTGIPWYLAIPLGIGVLAVYDRTVMPAPPATFVSQGKGNKGKRS